MPRPKTPPDKRMIPIGVSFSQPDLAFLRTYDGPVSEQVRAALMHARMWKAHIAEQAEHG